MDPSSLFQGEVPENMVKVQEVIVMVEEFKGLFEKSREKVVTLFPEGVEPVPWLFNSRIVFKRLNAYLQRLKVISEFFEIALEYSKLEKVEIGGLNGKHISTKVFAVFDEFNMAFNVFRSVSYNPAEPEDTAFLSDYKVFKEKVLDLDRRMAALSSQAFNECHNFESIFKMINVWDTMLKRPIIQTEITPKYSVIIDMLNDELDIIKTLYNDQLKYYEETGFMEVDRNWPPVAGGLVWILKMANRVSGPVESFKQFENS
ncbi:dynein beta chain, ciliary-like [Macrosteles quadrilineatus]|uniref:dynein beta chain, ciliary-like n=1 Tax=Macrosteles quadrilineatus TaxID=74068 RepID=UPI0023E1DA4A|nr:dynein beta chain, ciliary-like [Macrosteles quadrilineatus]